MSDEGRIRVSLSSAYPAVRLGLRAMLEGAAGVEVAEPGNVVDVAIVDLDELPEDRLLVEESGAAATVFLADPGLRPELELGQGVPYGYLPREATAEEIGAAVHAVAQGLIVVHPAFAAARSGDEGSPAADGAGPLTERELEVLKLLAGGLPNKGIALRLGISEHTVKFHVGSILGRLGVASRAEAVMVAARRGLLPL